MKKCITFILILLITYSVRSQNIGIGTTNPHGSAVLDLRSNNKGILVPRVNLDSETDSLTIPQPATSLMIYNINNNLPDGSGYYFWNGNRWAKLATRANLENLAWGIGGNIGTNPDTNFIGTRDARPLVFKVNNVLAGKIEAGPNNVFLGQFAGNSNSIGTNNTYLGHAAGASSINSDNNLFAGHFAGNGNRFGSQNVFLGQDAGSNNQDGNNNTFVGEDAGIENTDGNDNVFIGNGAGRSNTEASNNTAVGFDALSSNISGNSNIAIGKRALYRNQTASNLIAIGDSAQYSLALPFGGAPSRNIAIGPKALYSNIAGRHNTAIGWETMRNCSSADSNIAVGHRSMYDISTGVLNTAIGYEALVANQTGDKNTAVGGFALTDFLGEFNTGVGIYSFPSSTVQLSGDYNTAIGAFAGPNTDNLTHTTCVGASARVSTSNTMVFGNGAIDRWAFGLTTTSAQHALEVGNVFGNGNGAYLTQGGVWTNASDANKKEDFTEVDKKDLLEKIGSLSITKWKYKGSDEYHIGPTAQDFHTLFGLGVDDKGISTIDPAAIALLAIKALKEENEILRKELEQIKKDILELRGNR